MMLIPVFTIKLGQPIFPSQAVIGKFDGKSPSLACVTTGGKILIHSPHEASRESDNQLPPIRYLNFNRKITSLACGVLDERKSDLLFVGSESNITAYDVERNSELFFHEVSDGVNALTLGKITSTSSSSSSTLLSSSSSSSSALNSKSQTTSKSVVVAGGNCSILGFDHEGNEAFWTVTGDNISSLCFCDIDSDGQSELLVGSDDFEIRIFKHVELLHEITETDKIILLCSVKDDKFAYGLANGTVGVYKGPKTRLWRVKTKTIPTSLIAADINEDGVMEIISGWMNGTFNIRNSENGELLYRGTADSAIAAIIRYDYKLDGKPQLIICSQSGEVIGYQRADAETIAISNTVQGIEKTNKNTINKSKISGKTTDDQKALVDLQNKKQDYLSQLKLIDTAMSQLKTGTAIPPGSLQPNTNIKYEIVPDLASGSLNVMAVASTDVIVVSVIIIDLEGSLLEGCEVVAVSPAAPSRAVTVPVRPAKYQACTVKVQAHVAVRSALDQQLHVLEANMMIPKFACFRMVNEEEANAAAMIASDPVPLAQSEYGSQQGGGRTRGQVILLLSNESLSSLANWIATSFILSAPVQMSLEKMKINFLSVCGPVPPSSVITTATTDSTGNTYNHLNNNNNRNSSTKQANGGMSSNNNSSQNTAQGRNRPLQILATEVNGINNSTPKTAGGGIGSGGSGIKVKVRTDCIDLAAEVVQDIARYFNLTELETEADFPEEMEEFEEILRQVSEHNESRLRLSADMADDSQRIKALVVRAEDSRVMCDMESMRRAYTSLYSLNTQLLTQHQTRTNNQEKLLMALRSVNLMIQRAAGLRIGSAKLAVIAECRKAVKNNNMGALERIIKYGSDRAGGSSNSSGSSSDGN